MIHFNRVFHYKPSILGYLYSWKHLYISFYTFIHHHKATIHVGKYTVRPMDPNRVSRWDFQKTATLSGIRYVFPIRLSSTPSICVESIFELWNWDEYHGHIKITSHENHKHIGGGFRYFFIFTPTWARIPF